MDADAVTYLSALIQEYPYFHSARILLLQALYKQYSPYFDEELRKSAILVPNRHAIFHLIEKPHYTRMEEHKKFHSESTQEDRSTRTKDLIDTFLDNQPQETKGTSARRPIDATQDYIGYILQNEETDSETIDLPMNGDGVVETFLQQETGRIILKENESVREEPIDDDKTEKDSEILTEIMAGIYIRQGKYENAIKIIRQLSLKYPKKNRYFADQIRFLEKLIINNKNK